MSRRHPAARTGSRAPIPPRTGFLYIPANNLCMDFEAVEANYIAGTPFVGANVRMYAGPGRYTAASSSPGIPSPDARSGRSRRSFPVWSGVVVTGGDVVFYGTMEGWSQGGARPHRWRCCGSSRPARESSASRSPIEGRREAVRRRPLRRRRLGRCHRRWATSIHGMRPRRWASSTR